MSTAPDEDAREAPPRSPRRRRWLRRLLGLLVLAVLLPVVLVQALLWSDWPRRTLERSAAEILGQEVRVGAVRVGWLGTVEIKDFTIRQPDDGRRIHVPRARLRVTPLPLLPFQQEVHSISLDTPSLHFWLEDEALPRLPPDADVPARDASRAGFPRLPAGFRLPEVVARDARVELRLADGRTVDLSPVQLRLSQAPGSMQAALRLELAGNLAGLSGTIATTGDHRHELRVNVSAAASDRIRRQYPDWAIGRLDATWRGRLDNAGVVGTLDVLVAELASASASGRVAARIADGVMLRPEPLRIELPGAPAIVADCPGGAIRLRQGQLGIDGLILRSAAGVAAIDASADLPGQTGSFSAQVRDFPIGASRCGVAVDGTLSRDRFSRPIVAVSGTLSADTPDGPVSSSLRLEARGDSLRHLQWVATGEQTLIRVLSEQPIRTWVARGDTVVDELRRLHVSLQKVDVPDAPGVDARGGLSLSASLGVESWWLWGQGRGLSYRAPRVGERPLEIDVRLDGTADQAEVRSLWMKLGDATIQGWGAFRDDRPDAPLQLDLSLRQFTPAWGFALQEQRLLRGAVEARLALSASFAPLDFRLYGLLIGHDVNFADIQLGQMLAMIEGRGDKSGLSLRTHRVELLSGRWSGDVRIPRDPQAPIDLLVSARGVRLDEVSRLVGIDPVIRGRGNLQLQGSYRPNEPAQTTLQGVAELSDVEYLPLRGDRVLVPIIVADHRLRLTPVASAGRGNARLRVDAALDDLRVWSVSGRVSQWPVRLPDAETSITLSAASERLELTLASAGPLVVGDVDAALRLAHPRYREGSLAMRLTCRRQRAELVELRGAALGAEIVGRGVANLERPDESTMELRVTGLSANELVSLFPAADGLAGRYDLSLRVSPPTVKRPTGPLEAELRVVSHDASYRDIPLGHASALAHIDRGPDGQPFGRISVGEIDAELAGGSIRGFARLTRITRDDELRCLANLELDSLRLEELSRASPEHLGNAFGDVDGGVALFGDPRCLPTLDVRGRFSIQGARLSGIPGLSAVFSAANAGPTTAEPVGSAEMSFRLEQDRLAVPRLTVFDRGTYLEGYAIELRGLSAWPETELQGFALASARPLRDVRIPVLSSLLNDVDQVINALQREVTAVRIGGTVLAPKAAQVGLGEIYGSIRWFFGG